MNQKTFIYDSLPNRVLFGAGRVSEVKQEIERLGAKRALVLATPQQVDLAQRLADLLDDLCVGIHDRAVMHVPYETVEAALKQVKALGADALVAPGGGSTIGLAKGLALEMGLPILAIPTTYAGSEMTPIWGLTKGGRKITGRDPIVKPKTVIYDPELVLTLPPAFSATSGMNAMAHAVEALYAENTNPITSLMAEESIRALAEGLPKVQQDPSDLEARHDTLYGSWLAATVLSSVGMALHHKLCHVLGGSFNLPHAEVHTVILPHATAYNASHAPQAMQAIGRALGVEADDAAGGIFDLSRGMSAPTTLKMLGLTEDQLDEAAGIAVQNPYYNPRPVTKEGVRELLGRAYVGLRPEPVAVA